jgi:CheY-like chemotaxis protein
MNNGSINVSIKYTEMNEIDICISMFTPEKSKIAKLFKYSMTNIKNLQTPIENYDGISLVITSYIASKLGKGIDYDDSLCQIHIKIKDGFNLLTPPEIKGRPRKNSISDGICFEKKDMTMTMQVTPRLIQRTKLASHVAYSYFRKLLPFKINTPLTDIECQSDKCDNASDMDVGNEFEEKNEIKDYIMAFPRKAKTASSIGSRRKNRCSTFHSCTNNIIKSEEVDIIIADDNIVSQSVLKRLLESFAFHSAIANDGSECIHIIDNLLETKSIHHLKLIFMDLQMPIMDGITATKEILKILKNNKVSLPIIGVSADNNEQDRINFFNAGISEFIAKPITKSKLESLLTKYKTRS